MCIFALTNMTSKNVETRCNHLLWNVNSDSRFLIYLVGGKYSGGNSAILVTFGKSFNRKTFNRKIYSRNILNRRKIVVILGVGITHFLRYIFQLYIHITTWVLSEYLVSSLYQVAGLIQLTSVTHDTTPNSSTPLWWIYAKLIILGLFLGIAIVARVLTGKLLTGKITTGIFSTDKVNKKWTSYSWN